MNQSLSLIHIYAKNGTYTNAVYGMTRQLLMLMDGWKPDYLAVMFDKTRNTFRRRLYAEYKAQRKETDLPLKEQFLTMEKILADSGIPVFFSDNYEADDLAGTMAEKYAKDMQVVLVSKDKDYLQDVYKRQDLVRPDKETLLRCFLMLNRAGKHMDPEHLKTVEELLKECDK